MPTYKYISPRSGHVHGSTQSLSSLSYYTMRFSSYRKQVFFVCSITFSVVFPTAKRGGNGTGTLLLHGHWTEQQQLDSVLYSYAPQIDGWKRWVRSVQRVGVI